MPYDIVRLTDQLRLSKATDFDKGRVGIANPAFKVSLGDNGTTRIKKQLLLGDGKILAHGYPFKRG
ncbi:hypothetical protein D3C78_1783480 [compost metagenome]